VLNKAHTSGSLSYARLLVGVEDEHRWCHQREWDGEVEVGGLIGEGEMRQRIRERIMQEGNMVQPMHRALFFSVIIIRVLSFGMLPVFPYWWCVKLWHSTNVSILVVYPIFARY
jgi:hypothetical protein